MKKKIEIPLVIAPADRESKIAEYLLLTDNPRTSVSLFVLLVRKVLKSWDRFYLYLSATLSSSKSTV